MFGIFKRICDLEKRVKILEFKNNNPPCLCGFTPA